jgi:hypothetical protein
MATPQKEQIIVTERLQLILLKDFERIFADGTATPTDRATLARLLGANGWSLDPSELPEGLRDKVVLGAHDEELEDTKIISIAAGRK